MFRQPMTMQSVLLNFYPAMTTNPPAIQPVPAPAFSAGVAYAVVPTADLQPNPAIYGSRWQVVVRGRQVGIFSSTQR